MTNGEHNAGQHRDTRCAPLMHRTVRTTQAPHCAHHASTTLCAPRKHQRHDESHTTQYSTEPHCEHRACTRATILHEMCFNLKLSGNDVYFTILSILLVKIMLCSKLHRHKSFKLKHISCKIRGRTEVRATQSSSVSVWLSSPPRKALRGGIQKTILAEFSGNVGDSRQMLTKTSQWLQERASDTPKKGLLWMRCTRALSRTKVDGSEPPTYHLRIVGQPD